MSRRTLLNLVLLGLLAALALLAVLRPGLQGPAEPPPLAPPDAEGPRTAERITVEGEAREGPLVLVRGENGWRLEAPFQAPANEFRVNLLLSLLQARSQARYPAAGRDLAEFHLDPPRLRVRLGDTELAFGDTDPLGGRRYILFGDTIHLVADRHFATAAAPATDWVNPAPLPPGTEPVRIALPALPSVNEGQARTLVSQDGSWHLLPPDPNVPADALTTLVEAWHHAQALTITHGPAREPLGRVVIATAAGTTLEVQVLALQPDLVLARPDLALRYHLPAGQASRLLGVHGAAEGVPTMDDVP